MKIAKQTIEANGLPIRYEVAGEGEPVVLVHGLSESTRVWYRNLPELAKRYRIYLIDLPGFGAMRKFRQYFDLKQSGAWLYSWMQALELEKASLVGHSMGGYVSMALAAAHPELIKRLVLVDSIGISFNLPVRRLVYPALKAIARTMPSFWMCIGYDYLRAGPSMILNASQQIVALETSDLLSTVQVPTLVIWGEHDDLVPFALGRQLHTQLSGARLFVMPGTNHFCMFERPDEFNRALLGFLQGREIGIEAEVSNDQS
ncbi:MAG TPA: alpha/beta hydrolase [Ktedonobacteraceae bacterium]|nr:alpha/beta hydrolase [Ktedonobacteraceae bacterium]